MTIYLIDVVFSVKAKRFNKMFTSILALFFSLRIANISHFYAPSSSDFLFNKLLAGTCFQLKSIKFKGIKTG